MKTRYIPPKEQIDMKGKGIFLQCQNPQCKKLWRYKGNSKFFATCPNCMNKVNIRKCNVENKENILRGD